MASRLKNALSSKISLVSVFTPECKPPNARAVSNQREQEKEEEEKLRDSKCFYKNAQNKIDCISIDST